MALALYRKYRPKTFGDILGQETVTEILKNAAKQNRIGHAYLFFGPRGTGKTTTARILAKVANCETREKDKKFAAQGEPCNVCAHCTEIDAGRALDVIEIDAASNRGIDEIRSIREGIKAVPSKFRFKVFIIDEVHMLTREAVNALLKTLEEPPAHSIFVLATTEFEKIPATITSRAQRFTFKKISKKIVMGKLAEIAKAEQIHVETPALELIAAASEGSVRDGESLLDQMAALNDPETPITLEEVETVIGKAGLARLDELAAFVIARDLERALDHVARLNESGQNVVQFTKDFIHYLRHILSLRASPALEAVMENQLTKEEIERLKTHAKAIDPQAMIAFLKALIEAYSEMRYSPLASIPLEVALIEHLREKP